MVRTLLLLLLLVAGLCVRRVTWLKLPPPSILFVFSSRLHAFAFAAGSFRVLS
jgi:hypothetical protein